MTKFNVPDMSCGHCVAAIEKALAASDSATKAEFDLESHTVSVDSSQSVPTILAVLKDAGYAATPV